MLPNWATVLLLGMYMHNRGQETKHATLPIYGLGLSLLVIGWTFGMRQVALDETFPFRNFIGVAGFAAALTCSACITFLYVTYTWLVFEQWSRQKSGGNGAVSSEFVIAGVIFHPSRVQS